MPLTSLGFIRSTGADVFTSSFLVDGVIYHFIGRLSATTKLFTCYNATLTYNSKDDLTATRQVKGFVGPSTISMEIDNGPTISGTLDLPIYPPGDLDGSGIWNMS
ncbi:hypothetical protein JR316_0007634 [Psilocybe cubensis]|uniref:Uncharacterized protein n=2 Tax=Psilocybe cubensis TaxID=181762 RepID=A0ACB8GUD5_PSICU|nr:hypothetical protein JR316_0007634 [Psilocybe cubensis]KAH9479057.1 hypothetical protein JR316_0007634 [Psilocybe cubensis]